MEPATNSRGIANAQFAAGLGESGARISFSSILDDIQSRSCHAMFCEHQTCPTCRHTALGVFVWVMGYWETFLEDAIVHEMCIASIEEGGNGPYGRVSFADKEQALQKLRGTLYDEETKAVLEGATTRGYIILHDPQLVCAVADYWVQNSQVSAVVERNQTKIENLINIRHAAAHASPRTQHLLRQARQYFASQGGADDSTEVGAFLLTRGVKGQLMVTTLLNELSELAKSVQSTGPIDPLRSIVGPDAGEN